MGNQLTDSIERPLALCAGVSRKGCVGPKKCRHATEHTTLSCAAPAQCKHIGRKVPRKQVKGVTT